MLPQLWRRGAVEEGSWAVTPERSLENNRVGASWMEVGKGKRKRCQVPGAREKPRSHT